jgi:hypothetical protein
VVIQGGKNSPGALHRAKTRQYQDFSPDELAFMFDDSLLGSAGSESEHLKLIDQFLGNCIVHGTILKPTKTKLCRSEVVHQGLCDWIRILLQGPRGSAPAGRNALATNGE